MQNNKPEEPSEEDCCHNGCTNCVFDIYAAALKRWELGHITNKHFRNDLLSQTRFKPFVLSKIKKIALNTYLYLLKPQIEMTDKNILGFLPYSAGQHLSLRINKENLSSDKSNFGYLIRNFTLVSLSQEQRDCSFEVIIKLYENSDTSNFIKKLQIGDVTYWRGPYGYFKHHPNQYSNLIILCMGTGIAPMYPVIKEILYNENDETTISLLYGCKQSSEIILRKELGELCSYWNFRCIYYLSEEFHQGNKKYNEEFVLSKISNLQISKIIHNKLSCFFLICGSENFTKDMKQNLDHFNIKENMIHVF